jgi:hypothetical protein
MIIFLIIVTAYLLFGFAFKKPKEWSLLGKVIGHILWLPILIIIMFIFKDKNTRIL